MSIDARQITLTQWLSPAFPLGSFAFSHGLESAVQAGWVSDRDDLFDWLQDLLDHGSARADAGWLALSYAGVSKEEVTQLDQHARAFSPASERVRESAKQGASFVQTASGIWALDLEEWLLPIALGRAVRLMDMDREPVAALYLHAFMSNLVSVAQRLMPLGQSEAQDLLAKLTPKIVEIAATPPPESFEYIHSNALLSDIAAMQHETLNVRLFQS